MVSRLSQSSQLILGWPPEITKIVDSHSSSFTEIFALEQVLSNISQNDMRAN